MRITSFVVVAALATAAVAAPADAAAKKKKPKPITKTYQATAPAPDFTNLASEGVCKRNVPQSWHTHTFKAPAIGKLSVVVSEFLGDWDVIIVDPKGTEIASGELLEQGTPASPKTEPASAKIRKPGSYQIIACNWLGGSTAKVSYTFTYA